MKNGRLIVIEGACDGIGKSTQYSLLKESLIRDGEIVSSHHFPSYDTYQGLSVEKYLNGEYGTPKELSPYFVNNLYASDRAITWYTQLKKLYEEGNTILLDRYTTSSLIYQSSVLPGGDEEKKKFIDWVMDFEYNKVGIKEPDKVIFLHAPFELVTDMRSKRKTNDGISNDIHERDLSFMRSVYDSSLLVADYLGWDKIECAKNGQMRSIEDIHEEVYSLVKRRTNK